MSEHPDDAEAAIQRVRDVLDTSQTDNAVELEQAVRRALDGDV